MINCVNIACSLFISVYCKCDTITCLKTQLLWSQHSRSTDEYDVIWDWKCQRKKDNISSVASRQVNFPCGDQGKQHQQEEWDLIWSIRQTEKTGKWWTGVERNWKWKRWTLPDSAVSLGWALVSPNSWFPPHSHTLSVSVCACVCRSWLLSTMSPGSSQDRLSGTQTPSLHPD